MTMFLSGSASSTGSLGDGRFSGNVGIFTSGSKGPNTPLHIRGDFDGSGGLPNTDPNKGLNISKFTGVQSDYGKGDKFGITFTAASNAVSDFALAGIYGQVTNVSSYVGGSIIFATRLETENALTAKMAISSSGNVGIGVTSPSQRLEVAGAALINNGSSNHHLYFGNTSYGIHVVHSSGVMNFVSNDSTRFSIKNGGDVNVIGWVEGNGQNALFSSTGTGLFLQAPSTTEKIFFRDLNGNVGMTYDAATKRLGIGTTSPSNNLTISGSGDSTKNELSIESNTYPILKFKAHANNANNREFRFASVYNSFGKFEILSATNNTAAATTTRLSISGVTGDIEFPTANAKLSGSATSTGSFGSVHIADKVGIATTSPTKTLEVDGSYNLGTNAFINYNATYPYTINIENTAGVGNLTFQAGTGSTGFKSKIELQGGNTATDASITLTTADDPRMTILNSGNVGIATTSPNYSLEVAGNVGINGALIHNGDGDTYIQFATNKIGLYTGNTGNDANIQITKNLLHVSASANALTQDILKVDNTVMNRALHLGLYSGNSSIQAKLTNGTTNKLLIQPSGSATEFGGNVSGSSTSTGSFGQVQTNLAIIGDQNGYPILKGASGVTDLFIGGDVSNVQILLANLLPGSDSNRNLGSSTRRWANGYFTNVHASGLVSGSSTSTGSFGHVKVGADNQYGNIEFVRNGGAAVGGIGWHSDACFYVAGHPLYGPTAGNDVKIYGFGSDIHIGDGNNGNVITVLQSNGNVGIKTTSPATELDVRIAAGSGVRVGSASDYYLTLGEEAYSTSNNYVGLKTDFMSGGSDYMILSGKTDGNTYVSAKNGWNLNLRGGGNDDGNAIIIYDSDETDRIDFNTTTAYFNGNVGIGTTSPSNPLHVYHATTNGVALFESGDAQGGIALKDNSTSNNVFLLATGDDFGIQTGGVANRLTVKSDGKVGIGDDTPSAKLHIKGGTYSDSLIIQSSGTNGGIRFMDSGNVTDGYVYATNDGQIGFLDKDAHWAFRHQNSGVTEFRSNNTITATIDSSGNFLPTLNVQLSDGQQVQWGGTNNAIFGSHASSYVAIKTGGTDRLVIDSSGNLDVRTGNVSGSATSTGSFGTLRTKNHHASGTPAFFTNMEHDVDSAVGIGTSNPYAGFYPVFHINGSQPALLFTDSDDPENDFLQIVHNANATNIWGKDDSSAVINFGAATNRGGTSLKRRITLNLHTGTVSGSAEGTGSFGMIALPKVNKLGEYFRAGETIGRYLSISAVSTTNVGDTHVFNAVSATGHLKFQTTSNDRMIINSTGVGIGITPTTKLDVDGAVTIRNYAAFYDDNGSTLAGYVGSGNDLAFGDANDLCIRGVDSIKFTANNGNSDAMTINSSGNVGIGTASPSETLHLYSSTNVEPTLKLEAGTTGNQGAQLEFVNSGTDADDNDIVGTIRFKGMNDADEETEYCTIYNRSIDVSNGSEDSEMHFRTITAGTLDTTMILQSGKVGIGTTSPGVALEVRDATANNGHIGGKINVAGDWNESNIAYGGNRSPGVTIQSLDSTAGTFGTLSFMNASGYTGATIIAKHVLHGAGTGNMDTQLHFGTRGIHNANSGAHNVSAMMINEDGEVGIGTDDPGATLDIVGPSDGVNLRLSDVTGNSTTKEARIGIRHYTAAEEDTALMYAQSGNGTSAVYIGGGTGVMNAVELIGFVTAATDTTLSGTTRLTIDSSGNVEPGADNSYNLGAADKRWANIFSADLQLSNEGTEGNEVDGTTGSWTIQEGEDDLYLLNRKNGKKYKFKLEEIT